MTRRAATAVGPGLRSGATPAREGDLVERDVAIGLMRRAIKIAESGIKRIAATPSNDALLAGL